MLHNLLKLFLNNNLDINNLFTEKNIEEKLVLTSNQSAKTECPNDEET